MHSRKNRYAPNFGASNEWFWAQIIFLGLLKSTPVRYHLSQENILFCSVLSGLSIVEQQQQQQPQQRRKKSATSKFYKEKSFFNKINEIILILTISLKKKTILTLQKEQSL